MSLIHSYDVGGEFRIIKNIYLRSVFFLFDEMTFLSFGLAFDMPLMTFMTSKNQICIFDISVFTNFLKPKRCENPLS